MCSRHLLQAYTHAQSVLLNSFYLQYHETINEALEAVPYDGVIIVHRGVYDEHLSINKPVAIIGASMWSSFLSTIIPFWHHFSSDSLIKVYVVLRLKKQLKVCGVTTGFPAK